MFSYLTLEQRVPADHPLRAIRLLTDGVLQSLNAEFDTRTCLESLPVVCLA